MLSCGPAPLDQVASLVDEHLLAVSPVVLSGGKRIFDDLQHDIPLRLAQTRVFGGGAVVLR